MFRRVNAVSSNILAESRMQVTKAINEVLTATKDRHPGYDLVERFLAAGGASTMEVQVNVAQGEGEPVAGRRNTWTDGSFTWHNIRAPKNAYAEPEWDDYELRFP